MNHAPPRISSYPTILSVLGRNGRRATSLCIRDFRQRPGSKQTSAEQIPAPDRQGNALLRHAGEMEPYPLPASGTRLWRQLHRLYQFAEQENFDRAPVQLYPQQDDTTCASEYMQAMMLHLANPASLLPAQIEMVDFWLDSWAKSLVIEALSAPTASSMPSTLAIRSPRASCAATCWGRNTATGA